MVISSGAQAESRNLIIKEQISHFVRNDDAIKADPSTSLGMTEGKTADSGCVWDDNLQNGRIIRALVRK